MRTKANTGWNAQDRARWVTRLKALQKQSKAAECAAGDLLRSLWVMWGKSAMFEVASHCGWGAETARQRVWMSEQYPLGDPIREGPLPYTHMRVIALHPQRGEVAQLCLTQKWGRRQLEAYLVQSGQSSERAPTSDYSCAHCECVIPAHSTDLVEIRIGKEPTLRYCGLIHAAQGLLQRASTPTRVGSR